MSALKSMERPIRNHVGGSVAKANTNATTEESVVGKKVETSNKAAPGRAGPAPQAPRGPLSNAARSEPPMNVDPGELLPAKPTVGLAARAEGASPSAVDDMDLEDETATLMFRRPEPPGPPRKPPPPKTKPAAPPAKPAAKPPLPAPTHAARVAVGAKAPAKPPPPKPVAKPPAPKAPEPRAAKPFLSVPTAAELGEPKLSERPLFEVTLGSEKPLLATPEAGEISLLAPRAPNMPLLAAPLASDVASLDLRPKAGAAAMPALPMLDFSRDVSRQSRSSHPALGAKVANLGRAHGKWLAMVGGTALIAGASWLVFHAAAAGADATAAVSSRAAMPGAHTLAASPAVRQPVAAASPAVRQPVAAANPEPVAAQPNELGATENAATAEAPAAATPPVEHPAPAEVALRPGAAAHTETPAEAPAAVERPERPAPVAAAEPVARPAATRPTSAERSSRASEPTAVLPPPAKAAPEPVAPPPAAPAAPTLAGLDGTPDFDQNAAMAALRQAAESAKRCQTADAPAGGVRIAVTFARSGAVSATQVESSVAGTPLGDCVVAKFQTVHVPPFRGSAMTVNKTVRF
jgi:hypothetical protein